MTILQFIPPNNIDWFSTLTLIATFLTALIALWTIKEMKRQRETSYHPELYLGNQPLYLYAEKFGGTFLPFDITTQKRETNENVGYKYLSIDIHNVGFAVAKAIEYQWDFDAEKIIEKINMVNKVKFFNVHYTNKKLEISIPKIGYKMFQVVKYELEQKKINYILPSSIERTPTKITLPFSYIYLYIVYLFSEFGFYDDNIDNIPKSHNTDIENFPALFLKLSYKDLHGKTHNKKFKLKFSFGILTSPISITDDNQEFGYQILISNEI